MNSLPEKWLSFSQGLKNANHIQTLDLTDIYGRISKNILIMRLMREQSTRHVQNNQTDQKVQKYYKIEYKKVKAKLVLFEAGSSSTHSPKPFQSKNKVLVAEIFEWDEGKASDNEEMVQVKVLMALADDELAVGNNSTRNDKWIDQHEKGNILLSMDEDVDWKTYLKYINIDLK
nr:retrovirus-related Pol polyprotein from transposon TNT 1-94 [Tanacetum cinerariifolium]